MKIRVVRGTQEGAVFRFERDVIRIGRDSEAELRFDPANDLDVSARHAQLFRNGDAWFVRDLDSRNGTWLNGVRVSTDSKLEDGDRLSFGESGPTVDVWIGVDPPLTSRTQVLRAQVRRQHVTLRATLLGAGLAVALLLFALAMVSRSGRVQRAAADRERQSLLATIDSQLMASESALASLRGEMQNLARALSESEALVRQTRGALERSTPGDASEEGLRRQLRSATEALARQQLAASLDFRSIEQMNRPAVALLFVESDDGEVSTATAFAVRSEGALLTVRHVLEGADGRRVPRRIAVQFSDSEQFFPARIAAISPDADLAVVRVENIIGSVPIVERFVTGNSIATGQPAAVIGFALGGETDFGRVGLAVARPLVTAAIILTASETSVQLQGYGAAGASGSPVFDAEGSVAAVLVGGLSAGEPTLVAIPAVVALRFLESVR
jgi:hypothetical protein